MALGSDVILDRVSKTLLDEDATDADRRWPSETELLDYLNAGQVEAVNLKPDVNTISAWHTLDDTTTRQPLPADGIVPLNVVQNDVGGDQTGRAIELMDRQDLDVTDPLWHTRKGTDVEAWAFDDRDNQAFYVYPRATGKVLLIYSAVPERISTKGGVITIPDVYENALYHWVLAHAYAKNAKRGDLAKFQAHLRLFRSGLGLKGQSEEAAAPTPSERTKTQTGGV